MLQTCSTHIVVGTYKILRLIKSHQPKHFSDNYLPNAMYGIAGVVMKYSSYQNRCAKVNWVLSMYTRWPMSTLCSTLHTKVHKQLCVLYVCTYILYVHTYIRISEVPCSAQYVKLLKAYKLFCLASISLLKI